jgi:hypothetical protein
MSDCDAAMGECLVAIRLKVPDNTAYTALTTLQGLGVNVARIERSRILLCHPEEAAKKCHPEERARRTTPCHPEEATKKCHPEEAAQSAAVSKDALENRIKRDESLFNPNIHTLEILDRDTPRDGELWIEPLGATTSACVGWRLFNQDGTPADRVTLQAAAERLLCNPAFQRARFA